MGVSEGVCAGICVLDVSSETFYDPHTFYGFLKYRDLLGVLGLVIAENQDSMYQSLEFVAEMKILAEMKIENRGKFFFSAEKQIDKHTFFLNSLSV